jgi:hypothetical protein
MEATGKKSQGASGITVMGARLQASGDRPQPEKNPFWL